MRIFIGAAQSAGNKRERRNSAPVTRIRGAVLYPCVGFGSGDGERIMSILLFHELLPEDHDRLYPYLSAYGDGSCQHSFVSMYALDEKYGDRVCEEDGFLYTLRSRLCDEAYRVYLAPMGSGDRAQAFRNVLEDAHRYGKKAKFHTLTEGCAAFVQEAFPGVFELREERDLAEYVYRVDRLASFSGKELKKRRQEVNRFRAAYGARASVTRMTAEDVAAVLEFEQEWVQRNSETHDVSALEREARFGARILEHFAAFRIAGVVLRIDGRVRGFSFGTKLNDAVFDGLLEKGDREVPHVYKVLRMELPRQCADGCIYENIEEDLGIPSLRSMKLQYQPDLLMRKYVVSEK